MVNHCVGHFVANYNRAWCLKSDPRGGGRERGGGGDGRMALGGSYITMLDAMLLTHEVLLHGPRESKMNGLAQKSRILNPSMMFVSDTY